MEGLSIQQPQALNSAQDPASAPLPGRCCLRSIPAEADPDTRFEDQRFVWEEVLGRRERGKKREADKGYVLRRLYGGQLNGGGGSSRLEKSGTSTPLKSRKRKCLLPTFHP